MLDSGCMARLGWRDTVRVCILPVTIDNAEIIDRSRLSISRSWLRGCMV